jgi:hypothetical protein
MADSNRHTIRLTVAALAAVLLFHTATSLAGPSFIASSHVKKGDVYTEVSVQLRCNAQYVGHDPGGKSDVVRIRLELTTVCAGAPPSVALSREQHRPTAADLAMLDSIEYDGQSPGAETLRLNFVEEVRFDVVQDTSSNWITIRVFPQQIMEATAAATPPVARRMVRRPEPPPTRYVVNLESWQRPPALADLPAIELPDDRTVFVSEAMIDGATWYRVRVGYYDSAEEAARDLKILRGQYPGAWIARETEGPAGAAAVPSAIPVPVAEQVDPASPAVAATDADKLAGLMADARRAMTAGELSKAVQIYTKVLQQPSNSHQPEAQEFLALARERNGQIAHAKAEYQRYLDVYPDGNRPCTTTTHRPACNAGIQHNRDDSIGRRWRAEASGQKQPLEHPHVSVAVLPPRRQPGERRRTDRQSILDLFRSQHRREAAR